jgi:hypothetical protein
MRAGGHEVGLHAGYWSYKDANAISEELSRIQAAASQAGFDQSRWGGRQHYLRWENPNSWRAWSDAGLDYDSTVGYARRVGFRAGTCHPYGAFDVIERRPVGLTEVPLIVMDAALQAQHAGEQDRMGAALRLALQCRRYGGSLTILWHNTSFVSVQPSWYENLISEALQVAQ